jgi:predicted nucleotidyltransferase
MNQPPDLPSDKARALADIVERLRVMPNVIAVVLGGSYASGLARRDSDIDIGVYYREAAPFAIEHVRSIALSAKTDDCHRLT